MVLREFYHKRLFTLNNAHKALCEFYDLLPDHVEAKLNGLNILSTYLWLVHSGRFTSVHIENEIQRIAQKFVIHTKEKDKNKKNILFIATELYKTGGHTRVLESYASYLKRWGYDIELILSNQSQSDVPVRILHNADFINVFGLGNLNNIYKINYLSEKIDSVDVVYNFQHPNDIVTAVALEAIKNKYHIFFNHADHRFFTGHTTASRVIHTRPYAKSLFLKRRGYAPEHIINPVSINITCTPNNKRKARQILGLRDEDVILITVSSYYKMIPNESYNMPDVIKRVLCENKNTKWLIVGITSSQYEKISRGPVPEGVICYGEVENPIDHLVSADIFVEGMPVGSTIAMFEAIAAGCFPVFAWGPEFPVSSKNDEPYIGEILKHSSTKEEFFILIKNIISDVQHNAERLKSIVNKIQLNIKKYSMDYSLKPALIYNTSISNELIFKKMIAHDFKIEVDDVGQCKWDYNHYIRVKKEPIAETLMNLMELRYPGRRWLIKNFLVFYNAAFNKRKFVIRYLKFLKLNILRTVCIRMINYYQNLPEKNKIKIYYRNAKNIIMKRFDYHG